MRQSSASTLFAQELDLVCQVERVKSAVYNAAKHVTYDVSIQLTMAAILNFISASNLIFIQSPSERGVWSGSTLFALNIGLSKK